MVAKVGPWDLEQLGEATLAASPQLGLVGSGPLPQLSSVWW